MAEFGACLLPLVFIFVCSLAMSSALENGGVCWKPGIPVVRNMSELGQDSYGRAGLSHMTIAGAVQHGMKEVEVWMQTFASKSGTPIHRHACEEVFITLKGAGTLYLAGSTDSAAAPGAPQELPIYPNATFTIPVDAVHQVRNTEEGEDLQLIVIISRPPMKSFVYRDWMTPHDKAEFVNTKEWDKAGARAPAASRECADPEPDDDVMSTIARILNAGALEGVTYSEDLRFEAGTPAIGEAIGLGAAIDYLNAIGMERIHEYEMELSKYLSESLSKVPGVRIAFTGLRRAPGGKDAQPCALSTWRALFLGLSRAARNRGAVGPPLHATAAPVPRRELERARELVVLQHGRRGRHVRQGLERHHRFFRVVQLMFAVACVASRVVPTGLGPVDGLTSTLATVGHPWMDDESLLDPTIPSVSSQKGTLCNIKCIHVTYFAFLERSCNSQLCSPG